MYLNLEFSRKFSVGLNIWEAINLQMAFDTMVLDATIRGINAV